MTASPAAPAFASRTDTPRPPARNDRAPARDDGAPTRNDGAPARNDGAPARNDGAPTRNDGAPARNDGAPARNDGAPAHARPAVSIVVPTFREAANIPALVEHVHAALARSGIEWELILADDDSGDGSNAVVAALAQRRPVRMETRRDPHPQHRDASRQTRSASSERRRSEPGYTGACCERYTIRSRPEDPSDHDL